MEQYFNALLTNIFKDVDNFKTIYNEYKNLTWIVIWWLWFIWIFIKYALLTCPIWIPFKIILSLFQKIQKNEK